MRALVLGDRGPYLAADHPDPQPGPGEVRVRVRVAGICSTDLELIRGYAGFTGILGHEWVGEVDRAEGPHWVGRRVVGTINLGCRQCAECMGFGPEHCPHRTVLGIINRDGAFADYLALPEANLLEVPEGLADEEAVFAEPLAAALRIREQVAIRPTDRMAVVGPGRLGLLIAQVLAFAGGEVRVLGRRRSSLALPASWGLATGLVDEVADDHFDLVVEATGNEAGLVHSLRLVRPRGTLVLKSTFHGAPAVDLTKLVVGEIRLIGSRCGPFAPALRLLADGGVQVRSMLAAEYPLEKGLDALEHARRPGVLKVLLRS